jgi:hypothetical protein
MANPSPTGTFTLQDTPDFAWRETGMKLTRRLLFLAGLTFWLDHSHFRFLFKKWGMES